MTGRQQKLSKEVELILNNYNLVFDKYIYNRGGTTIDSKIKSLDRLLIEYPLVNSILITDDRLDHIPTFEEWLNNHKISGRLKEIKINVVPSNIWNWKYKKNGGKLSYKCYLNDKRFKHDLYVSYYLTDKIQYKTNWVNGKRCGLSTLWDYDDKLYEQKYHL